MTEPGSARPFARVTPALIEAYPVWSSTVITIDVLVFCAQTVHGGRLLDSTR
jgi:hypothetical protein